MGTWGAALYSDDTALDVRATARAIAKLPFDGARCTELVREAFADMASNPSDDDYVTFWLALADSLTACGVDSVEARARALALIDGGEALDSFVRRGATPSDAKKRDKTLRALAASLRAPVAKQRVVKNKPEPHVLGVGELYVYPTFNGAPVNPYFTAAELVKQAWQPNGFAALCVVETGHTFGYLAWYRVVTVKSAFVDRPSAAALREPRPWFLRKPGPCSSSHVQRMGLERIAAIAIDPARVAQFVAALPDIRGRASWVSAREATVGGIALANDLAVEPANVDPPWVRWIAGKPEEIANFPFLTGLAALA